MWITPRFPRGSGPPPSLTDDCNETRTQAESMASPVSPIMQPISVEELERKAKSKLKPEAFDYLAGGAGSEETMRANREAFRRWRIVPRLLRNVARRDLGVEILGQRLPAPLMLAPGGVGACRLCRPSLFQQGVVGAFAQGFGLLTSDFGVGTSQDLGVAVSEQDNRSGSDKFLINF